MGEVMVRVSQELIERLKEKYPELRGEDNTTVVRIVLRKVVEAEDRGDA